MAKKVLIEIPTLLAEAVKNKRVILFLGAGASKEVRNSSGQSPPDSDQLRDILAQKFFNKPMKNRDVMAVTEMAIAIAGGRSKVFEAVRQIFEGYQPSEAHRQITRFNWRMIATTNYDLLVERAYSDSKDRVQSLVRFVKDDEPVEDKLQAALNPVQYLKLHGCLDHIHDPDIPPVLSREQYAAYSSNRTRLFNRLRDLARESSIVFIGYRLDDSHIRDLVYELRSDKRPRWYIVTPGAEAEDVAFWGTKNVEVLKCRFGDFMHSLDTAIPALWRSLPTSDRVTEFPIRKFFVTLDQESLNVHAAISNDLTYIHSGMPYEEQTPKRFYAGYDTGWGGIITRFDVRRKVEDDLLYKALLENEKPKEPTLLVLRGAAGSGKTIALKRTAFEAATSSGDLVLWLEESGALRPDVFIELHELCKRPIYLFVDQVALQVDKLLPLLRVARSKSLQLVVIGAERDSDWNTYCTHLDAEFPPEFLRVGNLSQNEVEGLLDLLQRHDCLGLLKDKPREEQVIEFMEKERADRQLLVALHELTQGKPFEEIVFHEHQRISPETARQLYLDIATMHQFSVKVRAGTISRISGIAFKDYEDSFFAPLQDIVKVDEDPYTGDYCYKTRHPRVAYLVFRYVCTQDEAKAHQFKRLIEGLDVGYSSDARALEEMTRGRALAENFAGVDSVRELYEVAVKVAPKKAFLHQQWAIFELNHPSGSIGLAETQAAHARELDPRNKAIIHTQAEIGRRQANEETSSLLKDSLRRRVRARLEEMPQDRFAISSRCKLLVDEVSDISDSLGDQTREHEARFFAEKIKDAEDLLLRAQQQFPDDADIIAVEARLRKILDQEDRALFALERALAAGPRGSGIAIRVAGIYQARARPPDALRVLNEALAKSPDDKPTHQALALLYLSQPTCDNNIVEHHLKKSFSSDDHNFEARYILAQFYFLKGLVQEAVDLFELIDTRAPETFRRGTPRKDNTITSRLNRYTGTVESIKQYFLFIRSGCYPRHLIGHYSLITPEVLDNLTIGQEVNFRIRFTRSGPAAVDIRSGRSPLH